MTKNNEPKTNNVKNIVTTDDADMTLAQALELLSPQAKGALVKEAYSVPGLSSDQRAEYLKELISEALLEDM